MTQAVYDLNKKKKKHMTRGQNKISIINRCSMHELHVTLLNNRIDT
jgi:hypothetical protein